MTWNLVRVTFSSDVVFLGTGVTGFCSLQLQAMSVTAWLLGSGKPVIWRGLPVYLFDSARCALVISSGYHLHWRASLPQA